MITLIACVDNNWGLGKDNQLLARVPQDLKHFREVTIGHICVFGRKTAESLPDGKPLPNRRNIMMTRDENHNEDFETATVNEILDLAEENHVFICGGAEIYELFMPHASKIILTSLNTEYESDTTFPFESMYKWFVENEDDLFIRHVDSGNYEGINYTIMEYLI